MKSKIFSALCLIMLFLYTAGCYTTEVKSVKMGMGIPAGRQKFAPVPSDDLQLKLISSRDIHAGEKAELIFSLIYTGNKKVTIQEWYTNENDNVKIFIQPYLTGMTAPVSDAWIELSPRLKQPVFHHPLTLMPGNQVMVVKELPFVQKIRVAEGKMRRYFIKGKINLQSLDLSSDVYVLQILSNNKTKDNN